jgi:DNA-binding HxlR family transcriptional regulator
MDGVIHKKPFAKKPKGKKLLVDLGADLREILYGRVNWIHLTQDRVQ